MEARLKEDILMEAARLYMWFPSVFFPGLSDEIHGCLYFYLILHCMTTDLIFKMA